MDVVRLGPNQSFTGVASERTAVLFCGLPAPLNSNTDRAIIGPKMVLLGPVEPK